jgi:hypothetical protein
MRNSGKASVIDCGGYGSTFDMILFPRVGLWDSHDRHGFIWAGEVRNRGGGDSGRAWVAARVQF